MRLVGTLHSQNEAERLRCFLVSQEISNKCEVIFESATNQMSYQVWIYDEDKITKAKEIFDAFIKNPTDSKFDAPLIQEEPQVNEEKEIEEEFLAPPPPVHQFKNRLTTFILFLCALFFFLNTLQQIQLQKEERSEKSLTELQQQFMFDIPPGYKGDLEKMSPPPYWQGIYATVIAKYKGETLIQGPLFVKIKEGEFWRLFTPTLLHQDILHILFNMLWLWFLGRPIERRIGFFRMLLFTLLVGIFSNTIQYLVSGPFFIGYSGIVTGLAGFIWQRERVAPWEGYPLNRSTILFLLFFIAAIFVLQVVAFFIQIFTTHDFAPNIANTAHVAGAVMGILLGRLHFFAQRVSK
jgi:GlpG protein